jgi:hypothetical protein
MGVWKFGRSLVTTVMNVLPQGGAAARKDSNNMELVATVGGIIRPQMRAITLPNHVCTIYIQKDKAWFVGKMGGKWSINIKLVKIIKRRCEILNVTNHSQRPIAFPIMKHELYHCTRILLL